MSAVVLGNGLAIVKYQDENVLLTLEFRIPKRMSSSGTAFSSDGIEVITRKLDASQILEGTGCHGIDFNSYYEIDQCIKFILDSDYQKV